MFLADQYELLDFGDGRKLERIGGMVLDRPAPAANDVKCRGGEAWKHWTARYELSDDAARGTWHVRNEMPEPWLTGWRSLTLELRPTPFGHVGLFAEHAENWDWLTRLIAERRATGGEVRMLNLFAYTGGATLAAAAAGAEVAHVDAARNIVTWARHNAVLSGLSQAPIRWLAEDASLFVARERRRGKQYEVIVLDPPSYGHGPKGQTWVLERDLPTLLADCAALMSETPLAVLLTCHSPGFGPQVLQAALCAAGFKAKGGQMEVNEMWLKTTDGRRLHAGGAARVIY